MQNYKNIVRLGTISLDERDYIKIAEARERRSRNTM